MGDFKKIILKQEKEPSEIFEIQLTSKCEWSKRSCQMRVISQKSKKKNRRVAFCETKESDFFQRRNNQEC